MRAGCVRSHDHGAIAIVLQRISSSSGSSGGGGLSSRRVLLGSLALAGSGAPAWPAAALKTVELRSGESIDVFEHGMSLSIVALRGSVPTQWVMDYRSTLGKYAGFGLGQRQQLKEIYEELSDPTGKQSAGAADVVTLGDAWLGPAIARRLVSPIPNAEHSRWWKMLGPRWHALLRRDEHGVPSARGQVYAAPYRWGATLVAYREDRLLRAGGVPVADWADLLQPQLKGRVAFVDSSRTFIAVALKTLRLSANAGEAELAAAGLSADDLAAAVGRLRGQALLFSSRDHIRALTAGDAWACVGGSQDLIGVGERMSSVQVSAPSSGTLLSADLWAVPTGARGGSRGVGPSPLLPSWLEFALSPARGGQHTGLKVGAVPHALPELPPPHPPRPPSPRPGAAAGLALAHAAPATTAAPRPRHPSLLAVASTTTAAPAAQSRTTTGERNCSVTYTPSSPSCLCSSSDSNSSTAASTSASTPAPAGGGPDGSARGAVTHDNGYLPGREVLRRSEFLYPVPPDTLDLYNRVLRRREVAPQRPASGAPPAMRSVLQQAAETSSQRGRDGRRADGAAAGGSTQTHGTPVHGGALHEDELYGETTGRMPKVIGVQPTSEAGHVAAMLAHALRRDNHATLQFANSRGILKALKALAIAHDFLRQHNSTLSFVPADYQIVETKIETESVSGAAHEGGAAGHGGRGMAQHDHGDATIVQHKFTLKVWRRRAHKTEVDILPGRGPPMYDFSLDARREWKHKAVISQDMAFSMADLLYGQLVQKPEAEGVQLPWPAMEARPRRRYPGGEGTSISWSGPVLMSIDMAQAVTLFMALALFQQRLQREGKPLEVVVTVYRNTVAPRLDGRNGFVYKVLTRPAALDDRDVAVGAWRSQPPPKSGAPRWVKKAHRQRKQAAAATAGGKVAGGGTAVSKPPVGGGAAQQA
ncbi:hypothetical protein FOA52_014862 [Chlamydomonas sp. UWO 241]|nr:hypothetical protein FOA52_014862 [Chlamydomonas sp. UWO 241]